MFGLKTSRQREEEAYKEFREIERKYNIDFEAAKIRQKNIQKQVETYNVEQTEFFESQELPEVIYKPNMKKFFVFENLSIPVNEIISFLLLNSGSPRSYTEVISSPPEKFSDNSIIRGHITNSEIVPEVNAALQIVHRGGIINVEVSHYNAKELFEHFQNSWMEAY